VGWCQYRPREELSRIDTKRNYRELSLGAGTEDLWRISCFVTDKRRLRRDAASAALPAALEPIEATVGVVEAHPMILWPACSGVWQCVSVWEQTSGAIIDKRELRPAFGELD
jgi:hypothetical protein